MIMFAGTNSIIKAAVRKASVQALPPDARSSRDFATTTPALMPGYYTASSASSTDPSSSESASSASPPSIPDATASSPPSSIENKAQIASKPAPTEIPQAAPNGDGGSDGGGGGGTESADGNKGVDMADGVRPGQEVAVGAPPTAATDVENGTSNGDGNNAKPGVTSQQLAGGTSSVAADDGADRGGDTASAIGVEHSKQSIAAAAAMAGEPEDRPNVGTAIKKNSIEVEQRATARNEAPQPQTATSHNGNVEPGDNGSPATHDEVCATG